MIAGIVAVYIFGVQKYLFTPFSFYIPATTQTKKGANADIINVVMIGDTNKIKNVFKNAGWLTPDVTTAKTTAKIIFTSLHNKSYPTAPVSNLYLFKRKEDLAFELPTSTVRKRHHIRLWKTIYTYGGKTVFLGSDTFDSGIELAPKGGFPTHHVDAAVDQERAFLTNSLHTTGLIKQIETRRLTFPILIGFNGNGDWYYEDGNIVVFILK